MREEGVFFRQHVRKRPRARCTLAVGCAPRSARSCRTAAAFRGTMTLSLPERLQCTDYGVSEPAVPVGEAPRPAPRPRPAGASRQVQGACAPPRLRAQRPARTGTGTGTGTPRQQGARALAQGACADGLSRGPPRPLWRVPSSACPRVAADGRGACAKACCGEERGDRARVRAWAENSRGWGVGVGV